ncbi:carboxypeptidase-like regulatory domain-containing protein [Bacteroides sp.]|uniref:carboxypeptidase-like regulatory domain-containing protein n=1 Tax=Bacteroides sp. TaxID=29523 RepID=UPI0023D17313|nr:carboxypeptidase-like regulatory domain-containing protein [Bacteroides sp.]MDE5760026.1 carboxypeptidase-like regulatory domain-containing protein [Bacteroides sp.]MDE6216566.1 carboxypeptidase-like regulatory domain-containing protein [Bacteroides sp.]
MKTFIPKLIGCFALSVNSLAGFTQTVVSESTKEPIAYANIGVIDRNLGTVTDSLGRFSLKIPLEYANDSIRISSVGYIAQTFAVRDIANLPDTITLADDVIMLSEVVVKPQRIKHKTAGRKEGGGSIFIEMEGYKAAGQGLAIPLKVKNRAWLKEIGFTIITENRPLSRMKFRVNIYRKEAGSYVLQKLNPVYFNYDKSQLIDGSFSYIFPEEIMLEKGDFYVELEFLENFSNEYFIMRTKPITGKTRYRYASQSKWETLPFGAPVYVEYDAIE